MRHIRRTAVTGLFALWLAPLSAMAESQSSNASSDCSNGRCTRVESLVIEDRNGRRGWVRQEGWREGNGGSRPADRRGSRADRQGPRRDRGGDDDDDD
ncbi:MAG TPA: hypothetical protein VN329_13485 [Roseomonas sp.]|nr:hypothetical protein [Roseomonas sp.]